MRIGTVVAELTNGTWETLAAPQIPIHEQKQLFKDLKAAGGNGKYVRAAMFVSGPGSKRVSFKPAPAAPKKKAAKAKAKD